MPPPPNDKNQDQDQDQDARELEQVRVRYQTLVDQLTDLQSTLQEMPMSNGTRRAALDELQTLVDGLERAWLLLNAWMPLRPPNTSLLDFRRAIQTFLHLPLSCRWALCRCLQDIVEEEDDDDTVKLNKDLNIKDHNKDPAAAALQRACQFDQAPFIVRDLIEHQDQLMQQQYLYQSLERSLNQTMARVQQGGGIESNKDEDEIALWDSSSSSSSTTLRKDPGFVIDIRIGRNPRIQIVRQDDNGDTELVGNETLLEVENSLAASRTMATWGRVTRDPDRTVTVRQLEHVKHVLQQSQSHESVRNLWDFGPHPAEQAIPGGYIVRGKIPPSPRSRTTSSSSPTYKTKEEDSTTAAWIQQLDTALQQHWGNPPVTANDTCSTTTTTKTITDPIPTVCLVTEFARFTIDDEEDDDDNYNGPLLINDETGDPYPVLLVLNHDLTPTTNPVLTWSSNALALVSTVLFGLSLYPTEGATGAEVWHRLAALTTTAPTTLSEMTTIVVPFWWTPLDNDLARLSLLLLPLLSIQLCHELGHQAVAAWHNSQQTVIGNDETQSSSKSLAIDTAWPTLLPCLGIPPILCSLTRLRQPVPNLQVLFDFAVAGPLVGSTVSVAWLVWGLELTNTASPQLASLFPTLSVNTLLTSTLGGTVVDSALAAGFITTQDALSAYIPLHPFAIAGFVGLLMNALELLPLGATDGGRLALSVLGRRGHAILSGLVWLVLIVSSLVVPRADALVGAWAVYSACHMDGELPCRDEVTPLDPVRAVAAFAVWFVALLIMVPM